MMKDIGNDRRAYMINLSPLMILGYVLILISMISFWFYHLGWFQGGIWVHIFQFSPVLVGAGIMTILAGKIFDPRWVIGIGLLASLTYYALVVA